MRVTTFRVPRMDCPSEERLIRMVVAGEERVEHLAFDLQARRVAVTHQGDAARVLELLQPLGLGAEIEATQDGVVAGPADSPDPAAERWVLWLLLAINGGMFAVELGFGWVAESTGLISDSLDMLADALVYGVSLLAVGGALADQKRAAKIGGWLQALLAMGAFSEVARRGVMGSDPAEGMMVAVGVLALVANLVCVALLARHRHGGLHLRASWIFTTTDALANLGVIVAGLLVGVTASAVPDLVVGTAVALLVLSGAVRILRLR